MDEKTPNKEEQKRELMAKSETFAKTHDITLALSTSVNDDLKATMQNQVNPDEKETKKINKKIKRIWSGYRSNILSQIDLENYKKFCEIEVIRAENDSKLEAIKQQKQKSKATHWLDMHKGNLEDVGLNAESVPNKFAYGTLRGVFYFKKLCQNIPKLTWYILAGILGVSVIFLIAKGLSFFV